MVDTTATSPRFGQIVRYGWGNWRQWGSASNVVFLIVGVFMTVLVVYPTGWIVAKSFQDTSGAATLDNYAQIFSDPDLIIPFLNTLKIAFGVALGCTVIAAPLAWLTARTDLPWKGAIRMFILASYITPPFLGAVAWQILAAPNSGVLNNMARALFGIEGALFNIYTLGGIVFVISLYTFPYVFTLITNALDRMPGDLEDASSIAGASPFYTAVAITTPLAMPAILAGSTIAFLHAMVLFGTPAILGIPGNVYTVTTKIYTFFLEFPPREGIVAAVSLPMLLMTIFLLQSREWLMGRRSYNLIGGKSSAPRPVRLGKWRWPAFAVFFVFLSLAILIPYAAILRAAFSRTLGRPFSGTNITWFNFQYVWDSSAASIAIKNTLMLGLGVATLGTLIVSIIAYVVVRKIVRFHRFLNFIATAPIAIPGIILGVGLFIAYTRQPLVLHGTIWILFLAFLTLELAGGYQQQQSAMQNLHPELEEAGRIMGASPLRSFFDISIPLLRNGVIATWCFIFIGCVRELSAASLLVTSSTKVVSTLMFDWNEGGQLGPIAVLGLLMLAMTCIVVAIAYRVGGGGAKAERAI